ncbi:MAG TPA: efflux RND transporter periplasmic adaptor subunit [Noviherbaspirillum sp.]|nr:efflux RND transporter periplasmic adaptor subunit [Noviherbaspirillum sp.]
MNQSQKIILPFLLLLAGATSWAQTRQSDVIALNADQARKSGIATARVAAPDTGGGLTLAGSAVFPAKALHVVSAPAAGMVEAVRVDPMDKVAAGAPVVQLRSPQLMEWQRDYVQTSVQARLAGEKFRRDEALFKEGIIAESRLQESRGAQITASAALQERRQALRIAGMSEQAIKALGSSVSPTLAVAAPQAGIVVELMASPGQRVEAGTPLAKIAQQDKLWLELYATPEQIARISVGDAVQVAGCAQAGKVAAIGAQLASATQTMLVRAELPSAASCLRPNQHVEATVQTRHAGGDGLRVPAAALVRNGGKDYVFVQEGGGFKPVAVTVDQRSGDGAIVRGALRADAAVAVQGVSTLKGMWQGFGAEEGK